MATTTTKRRMSKRDREYLAAGAVAAYRELGPRHVVEAMELAAGRLLDAAEMRVVQEAVEAAFPGMDWDAPSHELAGKFPMN